MEQVKLDRRAWLEMVGAGAAALAAGSLAGCADHREGAAEEGVADAGEAPDASSTQVTPVAQDECRVGDLEPTRGKPAAIGPTEESPHIAFLTYPGLTVLDLIGPFTAMSALRMNMHLVWKDRHPIETAAGAVIVPSTTFEDCPEELEVLCVPGSLNDTGTMMRDPQVQAFLQSRKAKYVTSVCSGSLILGAAGLLRGYKATSHWSTIDILPTLQAEPVHARVVEDRNRITAAGVTAGIEFGLKMVELISGRPVAEGTQLIMEYDPDSLFGTGHPRSTSDVTVDFIKGVLAPVIEDGQAAASEVAMNFD